MEWKKRFIIGHLHNTEVLCFPLSSRTRQYRELIKAGSSPATCPHSTVIQSRYWMFFATFCWSSFAFAWIYWNKIQELKWRLCVWHTRNRWRSSFIFSNRSRRDHLLCPVHRNTVSCFPSIGLTAIKHLTEISSGQCFGDQILLGSST